MKLVKKNIHFVYKQLCQKERLKDAKHMLLADTIVKSRDVAFLAGLVKQVVGLPRI
jgi:hypothetical protein